MNEPANGSGEMTVDVLVAGSGAAGLTTALTCAVRGLRVLVCERADELGGTTALSGGRVWVPGNHFQPDPDADLRAGRRYLATIFDERYPDLIDAVVASGPVMLREVEAHTPHRFVPCPNYPDYHPDRDGATLGGRCLDMRPISLADLVPLVDRIRIPNGFLPISHEEWERWRWPAAYDWDLIERRRAQRVVTGGPALTAALLDGVVRAGGQVVTGHRIVDVRPRSGGILAARVECSDGTVLTVSATSVVLATGGYDQDQALRRAHLPAALGASGSSPSNTGDALGIAQRLGARLENLNQGWWMPMVSLPGDEVDGVASFRSMIRERGTPRMILVDRSGRRFVDEASPYNEFGKAMHRTDAAGGHPHADAFLIFDHGFRRRYPLPGLAPTDPDPEWIVGAPTLSILAQRLGVDADGLVEQVQRWNAACAAGVDSEFGRGANAYDRYYGDPEQAGNPNLGPIDEPPYYGLRLWSGTIGSKGGPVTDVDGRVLDAEGRPIPGLFAVGNAAAFWTGDGYPGPGATFGVGMTMGMRAGLAIAGEARPPCRRGEATDRENSTTAGAAPNSTAT